MSEWGLHTAADSYPSGDQVDASAVMNGVRRLADFAHRTHPGAAAFLGMTPDEQFDHFNTHLAPLYEQHGLPVPGVGRWLDFTDSVKDHWRENHTTTRLAMARRVGPGNYEHDTAYGTFGIRQIPDSLRDQDDPYRGGASWYIHPPSWDGRPDDHPSDSFWTKAEALRAVKGMEADPESYGLVPIRTASTDGIRYAAAAPRPKRPKPPWAEHVNGQPWPLQNHPTDHLIHMYDQLKQHHYQGAEPPESHDSYQNRMQNYAAELLDRHDAGDPEATEWGLNNSYVKPDYTGDQEWADNPYRPNDPRKPTRRRPLEGSTDGIRYAHIVEADVAEDLMKLASLSDENRVSVAEQVMERSGLAGRSFHIPSANIAQARDAGRFTHYGDPDVRGLQRDHSAEAEGFVNDILRDRGWDDDPRIRVEPNHWDLREPGSGQAFTDGSNMIGLAGEHTNAMTLLHETAHILTKTPHAPGGHGPDFQRAVHGLYHQHLGPEAADTFAGIAFPDQHQARLAAVTQDLVDRLKGEFKDWHRQQPKGSIFGGGIIGGLNEWPNIEKFLKDKYPAAHRNLDMGHEQAGLLMDGFRPSCIEGGDPYSTDFRPDASFEPYETGLDAEAKHGYDPKEVAAGMLLLHNKSDRFRGDMSQEDQGRLNDIAQKRFQMQRDYEQRTKTAMPAPLPQGTYFRYHPELVWSPGVTAHAPGGKMVGSLEWYDDDHIMCDLGTRKPGEIDRIQVPEDHRGQSIATSMFDFAKQHEPRLHHSDQLTPDGEGWSQYEQSRNARLAGRNGEAPPMTYEPFNTMWTNGIMARHAADGRPIAHLHWYPDGEIETIRVHPELQGRDIAKHVLAHAATHPETYEAEDGIQPSNNLTPAGRAFAKSLGHNPSDDEVVPAEGEDQWAWKAVQKYTPMRVPYTGQNEDEMSSYLEQPWTPPNKTASTAGDGWPVWWRGKHRPGVPFDKRWGPNHPEHAPGPWES